MVKTEASVEDDENNTIIVEREELMVPQVGVHKSAPLLRTAHFLNPLLNPTRKQTLPKSPSLFLSPTPNFVQEFMRNVDFKGRRLPHRSWKSWVEKFQQTHQSIWKDVGIFDAIRASIYCIKKDDELIVELAHHWCPEFNTFVFPWGECTVTLEDVMVLGGFSVLGVSAHGISRSGKFEEIKERLKNACVLIERFSGRQVSHYLWMDYFKGSGDELEHVALLVLWLSRHVFPTDSFDINSGVFDLAISLDHGTKIALAPAVLASIYRDLSLLKRKVLASMSKYGDDGSSLVLWSPVQLVQVWVWERFPKLCPEPLCLVRGNPRVSRWHMVDRSRSLRVVVNFEDDNFLWRPYCKCVDNWDFPGFYPCEGMWVSPFCDLLFSYGRCLRVCELVGLDCVERYLPHRVGMQFGLDQDIPEYRIRFSADVEVAWSNYEKSLEGLKVYLASRMQMGEVTVTYSKWWRPILYLDDDALLASNRERRFQRRLKSKAMPAYKSESLKSLTSQISLSSDNDSVSISKTSPLINVESAATSTSKHVSEKVDEFKECIIKDSGSKQVEVGLSETDSSVAAAGDDDFSVKERRFILVEDDEGYGAMAATSEHVSKKVDEVRECIVKVRGSKQVEVRLSVIDSRLAAADDFSVKDRRFILVEDDEGYDAMAARLKRARINVEDDTNVQDGGSKQVEAGLSETDSLVAAADDSSVKD